MVRPTPRVPAVVVLAVLALLLLPLTAAAQNMFAPVAKVNDRVITQYELTQRIRFYELLNAPGDLNEFAFEKLVEERLQFDAAEALGIEITEEQLQAGLEEFAGRADLTVDQFVARLGQNGVERQTFEDFVRAGVLWREVVGARFGPRASVTEAEVDRAISLASATGGVRVLLSEIILPANTAANAERARALAEQLADIESFDAFASAARQYSASSTRNRGGRLDWMPLSNLPGQIANQVLTLRPGEVTDPITVPNAIAVFQLRALEETGVPETETVAVEFARLFIPGGRTEATLAEAARIAAQVDTCDDLYGVAQGLPPERLQRDTVPVSELSGDIAIELAKLDENEISTNLTTASGEALVFLMLCGRTSALTEDVSREEVRARLRDQRLGSYATSYLAELRAEAVIEDYR